MSITPLDLQTMFVRLNDMSKEQAHTRHAASLQQEEEARKLAEQEIRMDYSVNASGEGREADAVDDESERQDRGDSRFHKNHEPQKEASREKEVVKDPARGTHIDISG